MKKLGKRYMAAGIALLVWFASSWVFSQTMSLSTTERWVLRLGLALLGVMAAAIVLWYMRPRDAGESALESSTDDAIGLISAAKKRMPRGEFDQRPLVLLLGTAGSCKTTVVTRSGMDPELLAGEADGSDTPTKTVNLWAVREAILAEAGGALLTDQSRWQRVVRALRAPRMAAAVGRGEIAPRAAVLCVSCDLFYAGGAGEQLETLAQLARQRLAEAAREFGLKLPVYVLFTKADRIPHYEAWAAPFTKDETRAPFGAALPFDLEGAEGAHAERLTPRLAAAFNELLVSLATRRLHLLGREAVGEKRLDAYELPREFKKLAPSATKFLTEVTRPTQLGVSPQLRGFYFVGARPVLVRDVASAPQASTPQPPRHSDATAVFSRLSAPEAATPMASSGAARKVPEWMFLDRFFSDVVLADGGAEMAARGGVRVHRLRRALLGTAMGIAAAAAIMFTVSWFNNRALTTRTQNAAQAVAALPRIAAPEGSIVFPSPEALRRLDDLRALLDTLGQFNAEGPPLHYRMGLWSGPPLLEAARPVWFQGFRQQLYADTWRTLVDSLRALPEAPTPEDDYGVVYNRLKAYLITTAENPRSTPEFLAPVLLTTWQRGESVDTDVLALSRLQFEYFADALAQEHPWPTPADARLVTTSRAYLNLFTGAEPIYASMLAEASKENKPIRLAQAVPNSAGLLASSGEVAGAFTRTGWSFMQDAFRNSDRYFQGEQWVVGDATAAFAQDRDRIVAELRGRYQSDYVKEWRSFVKSTAVVPSGSTKDAAQKLGILGGAQSPLLGFFALVSRNTDVDSITTAAFQPVHSVTPPAVKDKLVSEPNQPYANGLLTLQGALEQVANMPPVVDTASAEALVDQAQSAMSEATRAKVSARQVAQTFAVDTAAAQLGPSVASLLEAPITNAERSLRGAAATKPPRARVAAVPRPVVPPPPPAAGGGGGGESPADALNKAGVDFCRTLAGLTAKYPFNPNARTEATTGDIMDVLAPQTGALWVFQQDHLAPHLEQRGNNWVAKANGPLALSEDFVTFFNRAARISAAMFPNGAREPRIEGWALAVASKDVQPITLTHGGSRLVFNTDTPRNGIEWPPASGDGAKLEAKFGRRDQTMAEEKGSWALYRLIAKGKGEWSGRELRASYTAGDRGPITVIYTFPSGLPIMQEGWLGTALSCANPVVKQP